MLNQNDLDSLAEKLSGLPCPDCGGRHGVRLKLAHASSMVDPVRGPVVVYGFADDACNGFRQKAIAFASRVISGMVAGPCPFDRI